MAEEKWMTNFYYGQELRSRYMNGALNSGFRPGVYNASMALYASKGSKVGGKEIKPGLYLFIQKGTTFIFTNSYTRGSDGKYHRDLNGINNNYETLIKTVALSDMDICIAETTTGSEGTGSSTGISAETVTILGSSTSKLIAPAKKFYVVASMIYSPNQSDNSSSKVSNGAPKISLAIDNPLLGSEDPKISDSRKSYYYTMAADPLGEQSDFRIPDGMLTTDSTDATKNSLMNQYSYLMLGSCVDVSNRWSPENPQPYINSNGAWNNAEGQSGSDDWINNHVFYARGLPDYRQSLLNVKTSESPDTINNNDLNEFYIDFKDVYMDDVCFNTSVDWEAVQNIGGKVIASGVGTSNPKNRDIMYRLDHKVLNTDDPSGEYYFYNERATDIIEELNNSKRKFKFYNTSDERCLLCDMIFASMRHEYSATPTSSLDNLFSVLPESNRWSADPEVFEKYYLYNRKLKVVPFQWVSDCDFTNLDPRMDIEEGVEGGGAKANHNMYYGGSLTSDKIVPLDIGKANLDRLSTLVTNRNLVPLVVDYMRQHDDVSPFLDPVEATSLIPILVCFRKFKVHRSSVATYEKDETYYPIENLIAVDPISLAPTRGHEGRINPANVYSFLDFQFKTDRSNSMNFAVDDTYTVIPVMN